MNYSHQKMDLGLFENGPNIGLHPLSIFISPIKAAHVCLINKQVHKLKKAEQTL